MKRAVLCACLGFLASYSAFSQADIASPEFEVATIKLSGPQSIRGSDGGPGHSDPTRYTFGRAEILSLVLTAYNVRTFQISSRVPLDRDEFDLVAKVPPGATKEQFRLMLQNLLRGRFHLKLNIVQKEFPAYGLVVAKTGSKLTEATDGAAPAPKPADDDKFPRLAPNRPELVSRMSNEGVWLRAQREPVSELAAALARMSFSLPSDRPIVVDQTGLTGKYDFSLKYAMPGAGQSEFGTLPDITTALREQLGLELVPIKASADALTVESVDRMPSEN